MQKPEIIYYQCPDCPNNEFEIIKTLVESKTYTSKTEMGTSAGYYRCQCTACGLIQTFKSKSPAVYNEYHQED